MQSSLLDEIKQFVCSDIPKSLMVFTYIESFKSSSDYLYTNVIDTLKYLGLPTIEAEDLYSKLSELLEHFELEGGIEELIEALEKIVKICFKTLNITEEARKRIRSLTEDELEILKMAALGIVKKAEEDTSNWYWYHFDSVDIANFVSVMLSKDIDYKYIEQLFAKTLLAVKNHSASGSRDYYTMSIIPENLKIIKELATSVASEYPDYEYIRSRLEQAEPHQIAALLNPREDYYRAVYGYKVQDVLKSLIIEKMVYKGIVNDYIKDEIRKVAEEVAQKRCHELMVENLIKALESLGYEVDLEHRGFDRIGYWCRYTAARPGATIYVYIQPFAVSPPLVGENEKTVIVVEGMGAEIPRCLEEWRKMPWSWLARLANALWIAIHKGRVYVFESTVREGWQREIVEGLGRALRNVYMVKASGELEALPAAPTAAPPIPESMLGATAITPLQPMVRGVVESREILESIVAKALQALGFEVRTNVWKPARRGASIEVDVWAEKRVGDTKFKVYVSCKNWNKDVDRSVVDEEFGRVFNLQEVPHLRILVVKSMSRPAKEVAEADGFFVIELGEKATEANAEEIYSIIYRKLSDLFTGIAPPQLLEIAKRVGEMANELSRIAQELAKLSQSYKP